ncbi:hypothetical protein FisN_11Hh299 [Fistulifera solaris]|jgi:hypothetical protein|uniref:Uncharacterized protein n=1 Tax=Fistulifera solaris TaxID=1519565 RepID=A0A1Z5JL56_FISSO|nr:hypothetical protein FisN_11Hh299 [Fistulifera solaris]|eukprot:GAX14753.1 hypothetical protein FisN_11Hh299 [Fistulifera solaris]
MKKHSHLFGWIACLVSTSPAWQARGDDNFDFEPALTCDNQNAYANQNFVYLLGGTPGEISTGIMDGMLQVPVNQPVGPACGAIESSGRGFWFPVRPESRGQINVAFCTHSTAVLVPMVYTALVGNTTCEDLYCVAEGMNHPATSEAMIRSEGSICPNATSYGTVSFSATKDQLYFVYVEVTMASELSGLQATTMVTDFVVPNDVCSNAIHLKVQTQTITTDDFANVHTDVVPPDCGEINCTGTSESATAISSLWTNQWKGVWYRIPQEGMILNSANYTSWGVDACLRNNENLYISFYYGTDCQYLVNYMTRRYGDDDPNDQDELCRVSMPLPYKETDVFYMFVHTKNDPAIEGRMTVKVTPNQGIPGESSSSPDKWTMRMVMIPLGLVAALELL